MAEQSCSTRLAAERAAATRIGTRVTPTRTVDARYFRDYVLAGRSAASGARRGALHDPRRRISSGPRRRR
ncbi:MAG: hypothetical protein R2882_09865 [Gemmatimonadales bacterium]